MIYLASPYSDPSARVRQDRFDACCQVVRQFFEQGISVFSPIVHSHPLGMVNTSREFWQPFCCDMLSRCDSMAVLALPNWHMSVGVLAELRLAKTLNKPRQIVRIKSFSPVFEILDDYDEVFETFCV